MPEITAKILPSGEVELDGKGFSGTVCARELQKYFLKLGDPTTKTKPEYYDQTHVRVQT